MKRFPVALLGFLLLHTTPLAAQTPGQPPVEACKPGDFTVIGWPSEFGPKRDAGFDVLIHDDFVSNFLTRDPIWVPVIEQAVEKWNGIAGATWEYQLQGLTSEDATPFDGKLTISPCGVLFPCPTEPPPSIPPSPPPPNFDPSPFGPAFPAHQTTIAVTFVSTDGSDQAIRNSDIFFNPILPLSVEPGDNEIDFESVLLHELGHALGLGHNDNCVVGPTLMESLIDLGDRRRNLLSSENEGVRFLYSDDSSAAVRVFERDASLRFDAVEGALPPRAQAIRVFGRGGGRWVPTATTSSGGNWVRVEPAAGRFPFDEDLAITVDSASLPPGDYEATVAINIEDHAGPAATVALELHVAEALAVEEKPLLTRAGIVSSANLTSPSLAPGALFTLFGRFLALSSAEAQSTPLPTRLGGSEVLVNGIAAPLLYVSPEQINAQVPVEVSLGRGGIVVRTGLGQTPPIPVDLTETAPELFSVDGIQALALNEDNTVNSPENPAGAGSLVRLFLSGQGPVSPPVATGRAAPVNPPSRAIEFASAKVGGQDAEILFLGLAPGFVGLGQANIRLPAGVTGQLEVQLAVGDASGSIGQISVQ